MILFVKNVLICMLLFKKHRVSSEINDGNFIQYNCY